MNCEQYQQLISTQWDKNQQDNDSQKHISQCIECGEFLESLKKLEQLYHEPTYPFDSKQFVSSVIAKTHPKRRRVWKLTAAAILFVVVGIWMGSFFKRPEVIIHSVENEQPLEVVAEYSLEENPWKMVRQAMQYKNKNLAKSKYLLAEVTHRTENTEVLALASYQLALIFYHKENKVLHSISQLAQLIEFIEADEDKNALYASMGLHLLQDIYISLPQNDVKLPLIRQILKRFKQLSQKQEQEQSLIKIGD
ncbi:anti-sigma factor [Candidatus Uabimicrobium sp. HlEnr_7]|uniref:anti-sigma factor family protein n=1 Tax=Candidatus Uabimicrobium helgolandensis TaxID=3095367 RepID=UPI003557CF53